MKHLFLFILSILLLIYPVAATPYDFSVTEGDELIYDLKGTHSGKFSVLISEITISETEPVNIDPQTSYKIEAMITGEYANQVTTQEVRYGWDKLLYLNSTTVSVTAIENPNPLFSSPYEDNYPLIWPMSSQFYDNWTATRNDVSVEQDSDLVKIVEEIDATAVDGCLCLTTIDIENGIATKITQNETYFYTASGKPENDYHEITMVSDIKTSSRVSIHSYKSQLILFPPLLILTMIRMWGRKQA